MAEVAPDALKWLGSRISPDLGGVLSGIIGDQAHKSGYHRGWRYVSTTDYSRQLAEDTSANSYWACGIDMSFSAAKMKLYTGRLKAAADRNDPRLKYVREFYGTLNGTTVYGRTHRGSADATWESATSDTSHLWHLHISVLRVYANNKAVMQGILDVLLGKAISEENDEMDARQEKLVIGGEVDKTNALFFWLRTMADQNDPTTKTVWGRGGYVPGLKQIAEMVTTMRSDLVARDEAEKVRDAAASTAIKALASALSTGGGSVDSAAIIKAVNDAAAAMQTKVAELQTTINARNAEIDQLRQRLAAAAQAEANALNG